ncbi:hypothetical protein [Alteribacillus sp. YIM 98480]|uniref:hypothetical protein n=1 Tax=Alteribacillus sp. YIM 98480 TaxID=2606599 RepID=UPI001E552B16|nr:hypothetical protein [Alteribacillus sp. YIM 98480]
MRCDRTFAVLAKVPLYRVRLSGWALKLDIKNAKMYTFLPSKKAFLHNEERLNQISFT